MFFVVGLERTRDIGSRFIQQAASERGIVGGDSKMFASQALVEEIEVGHCQLLHSTVALGVRFRYESSCDISQMTRFAQTMSLDATRPPHRPCRTDRRSCS